MTTLDPVRVLKCLADETRLMLMLLVYREGELCVCEFTEALDASQPKVSRHLAQLRNCQLLQDRRDGQWVYYALSPTLPEWVMDLLEAAAAGQHAALEDRQQRLQAMQDRPGRSLCAS